MFQSSRHLEKALALVTSELTDLRAEYRADKETWREERKTLLDRIMVLSSPGSVRELQPRLPGPLINPQNGTTRPNHPGYKVDTRPPSPPSGDLTDSQRVVVAAALTPEE